MAPEYRQVSFNLSLEMKQQHAKILFSFSQSYFCLSFTSISHRIVARYLLSVNDETRRSFFSPLPSIDLDRLVSSAAYLHPKKNFLPVYKDVHTVRVHISSKPDNSYASSYSSLRLDLLRYLISFSLLARRSVMIEAVYTFLIDKFDNYPKVI